MSTDPTTQIRHHTGKQRTVLYIVLAALVAAAIVAGTLMFDSARASKEASDKAHTLVNDLRAAGLQAPDVTQIEQTLGTNGGAVCANATGSLTSAVLDRMTGNGAAGPGARTAPVDKDVLAGEALVLKNYCPDKLPEFVKYVSGLDLQNTLKG